MNKKKFAPVIILIGLGIFIKISYFSRQFKFAGTLEATHIDLSSRLSSVISKISVQEGDPVQVDQELIGLLCDDIQVSWQLAQSNFNRNEHLAKMGTVSREAMDQIKNHKQEEDIKKGWCQIRSPVNGTVLNRYREPGELVVPGIKLLTIADIKNIWAYIYVPQNEIVTLKTGNHLKGTLPELPGRSFDGVILKINEEAEFTPKNVQTQAERTRLVFGVKISFSTSNADQILKPGMTVEVELPPR